jgi:hypothetical protein
MSLRGAGPTYSQDSIDPVVQRYVTSPQAHPALT